MMTNSIKPPRPATFVPPIEKVSADGTKTYVLAFQDSAHTTAFECTADAGGLILAFSYDGKNILADRRVGPMYGSTFWTSPQSDWDWPPPPAIGTEPYAVAIEAAAHAIVLTSAPDAGLGAQVIKRFSMDLDERAMVLDYTIANVGVAPRRFAPWEISRVMPGGLTFYPSGDGETHSGVKQLLPVTDMGETTWFAHTEEGVTGEHKLFADGRRGWLAHTAEGLLFVKTFKDIPHGAAAPGEAEIEIYATPAYVEVEQQGAYIEIAPGDTLAWQVKWYLCPLPQGIAAIPGNPALVQLVDALF